MMVWVWAACDGSTGAPSAEPPGRQIGSSSISDRRFDAVMVDPSQVTPPSEFCETWATPEAAKPFVAPPLAGTTWEPSARWRWVNVWATWCGPCIAEMPRLVQWQAKLDKEGLPIDLVFLSVDAGQAEVDRFYQKEKGLPPSLRIASLQDLPTWITAIGLDAGTPIPIHLFVDNEGRTRCIRTGAIGEADYGAVREVLGG